MKVEVAVLGSRPQISLMPGFCGRKATLNQISVPSLSEFKTQLKTFLFRHGLIPNIPSYADCVYVIILKEEHDAVHKVHVMMTYRRKSCNGNKQKTKQNKKRKNQR